MIRTNGVIKIGNCLEKVNLFARSSRGIPGIEIVGGRRLAQIWREKLIFLTSRLRVKLPKRKYTLCIDFLHGQFPSSQMKIDYSELEASLLILLWSVSGLIELSRLEYCLPFGRITEEFQFESHIAEQLAITPWAEGLTLIAPKSSLNNLNHTVIGLEMIVQEMGRISMS